MKTCSICSLAKPLDAFHRKAQSPDGRRSICKECRRADTVSAEAARVRSSAWLAEPENRERNRARSSERYVRLRTEDCVRRQARYWANRDSELRGMTARYAADPESYKERAHRRRARMQEATTEDFTVADLRAAWVARGLSGCTYCPDGDYEQADHVVPLARGGANAIDNLVPACERCNKSKGARLLDEWLPGHLARLAGDAA